METFLESSGRGRAWVVVVDLPVTGIQLLSQPEARPAACHNDRCPESNRSSDDFRNTTATLFLNLRLETVAVHVPERAELISPGQQFR
ncbi:hypothetical protein KM043_016625 [Ampulex compressa]|nr:hypothetical protein KM043_016625 [Ampulex compressa]